MIAIAMKPASETEGPQKPSNVSHAGHIAELSSDVSKVENVTIGGIGRQRIKKAAADGEQTHEKHLEYEL
jgi:hypothetical protein